MAGQVAGQVAGADGAYFEKSGNRAVQGFRISRTGRSTNLSDGGPDITFSLCSEYPLDREQEEAAKMMSSGIRGKDCLFKDCLFIFPVLRCRGRSPDRGNAISRLFGPLRIDLDQVSTQAFDSGPKL